MKNSKLLFTVAAVLMTLAACSSTPQKAQEVTKEQIVEFNENEVPYVQVTKKNGKLKAEIVDASGKKISAE